MIKFEDIFNEYQSQNYPEYGFCTSSFYNELKEHYQKNKTEIFDYYEPKALADTLAEIDDDNLLISDYNVYNWELKMVTRKMNLIFSANGRPDMFNVRYTTEIDVPTGTIMTKNYWHNPYNEKCEEAITDFIRYEILETLKTLSIPVELCECKAALRTDISSLSAKIYTSTEIIVKQIPCLENVKFIEYTIPRIIYDKAMETSKRLSEL